MLHLLWSYKVSEDMDRLSIHLDVIRKSRFDERGRGHQAQAIR